MRYEFIPSRFVRDMVQQVTRLVSSIPKHNSCLHTVQLPRQMVTGIPLRVPPHLIGQYGQGHKGGTNETAVPKGERSIDCLYIGRKDNGSGHWVYNLATAERNSVNRFTPIPINQDHIDRINAIGKEDEEIEDIEEIIDQSDNKSEDSDDKQFTLDSFS